MIFLEIGTCVIDDKQKKVFNQNKLLGNPINNRYAYIHICSKEIMLTKIVGKTLKKIAKTVRLYTKLEMAMTNSRHYYTRIK